jgi:CDP-6-deoxy-D-xylo-4-hexulose-3-dehydrase
MKVPISGQVTGYKEIYNVDLVAKGKMYGGHEWTNRFEREFTCYTGARHGVMVNSGSSANLLALAALELPKGSEVVTCAVNFPTTVNAIIQLGLIPVFVDADPKTLNAVAWEGDFAAGIFAHTLGNPLHIPPTSYPIIEDCCDALGSIINGTMVGRRGVAATYSFYPAHHITTGEGGMVTTDDAKYKKVVESLRDWGRDCWCEPGCDNTCGKRFDYEPEHKYNYSRIGYNLKANEFAAAVGVAQMDRLDRFVQARKRNWKYLHDALSDLPISIVEATPNSDPSWFGFAFLTDQRNKLARYLDSKGIGNRPIMGGNLLRQTAYKDIEYRVIGNLKGADAIHERGLWIGCFPGINFEMLDYVIDAMREYYG